jgi:aldose 1-epimerase
MLAMNIQLENIGIYQGQKLTKAILTGRSGIRMEILNYGGIVHAWYCPDRQGKLADILLGCPHIQDYFLRHPYFGTITGRYANRISHGKFTLENQSYQLTQNLPPHHLHGGFEGLDRKFWDMHIFEGANHAVVRLTTISPHMEEGYPGHLEVAVIYTFSEDNSLSIEYQATTDRPTIINLTNHCYFNLSGDQTSDIRDHQLFIRSQNVTETNEDIIPTGRLLPVDGTSLDFNSMRSIGDGLDRPTSSMITAHGFDHNFVIDAQDIQKPAAIVSHPATGRILTVFTDQPGVQLYTGNWLDGVGGKAGLYKQYSGLCLETQHFPDSPNQPTFPDTTLLPGEMFYSKTIYSISCDR